VDPSWGTVYPTIAWGAWKYYGAVGVAARHYPTLKLYMDMLENKVSQGGGIQKIFCQYGDWNPVVRTDCHITAAATYLHDLAHMAEVATALGEVSDAAAYTARLESRRAEYHGAFWNPALGLYGAGTQAAQAVALWTGAAKVGGVAANVSAWLGNAMVTGGLTFGFIGVRYAYEALALNGGIESALRALLQVDYPSYGFELYNLYEPTTNLWESWDAPTHRQWLDESSRSHHYQASIHTFLRKHVVGLDMPAGASAWSAIAVRPYAALPLPADLAAAVPHARVTVESYRGTVEVSWARMGGGRTAAVECHPPQWH
jgi:alpha-L-rhamnosidase